MITICCTQHHYFQKTIPSKQSKGFAQPNSKYPSALVDIQIVGNHQVEMLKRPEFPILNLQDKAWGIGGYDGTESLEIMKDYSKMVLFPKGGYDLAVHANPFSKLNTNHVSLS